MAKPSSDKNELSPEQLTHLKERVNITGQAFDPPWAFSQQLSDQSNRLMVVVIDADDYGLDGTSGKQGWLADGTVNPAFVKTVQDLCAKFQARGALPWNR